MERNTSSRFTRFAVAGATAFTSATYAAAQDPSAQVVNLMADQKTAQTNTLDLDQGNIDYSFNPGQIEEIEAGGRNFTLVARDTTKNLEVNGKTLEEAVVLGATMIPSDNSTTVRRGEEIQVVPGKEKYFLVNGYSDNSGLQINDQATPRESIFVVSSEKIQGGQIANQDFVMARPYGEGQESFDYVAIGGRNFHKINAGNPFGGPGEVLIDTEGAETFYIESAARDANTGEVTKERKLCIQGRGYFPVAGTEVTKPVPAAPKPEIEVQEILPAN